MSANLRRATPDDDPGDRLYKLADVVLFLDGLGCLPEEVGESNEDAVRGWAEHMDSGGDWANTCVGYVIDREAPPC